MKLHYHSQNLNENEGVLGSMIRAGRCWWSWYWNEEKDHFTIGFSWYIWKKDSDFFSIKLGLADYDDAISTHLQFWRFAFYLHLDYWPLENWIRNKIKRSDEKYGNGRVIQLRFDKHFCLWVSLWDDPMEHRSVDPKWWHFSFDFKDKILGRNVYSERALDFHRIKVPMPEGVYQGSVQFFESTWKRPRWPWPQKAIRANIKMDKPVPVPGKGENSWDLDDDAIFEMTCNARTPVEAALAIANSAMKSRAKYENVNWLPKGSHVQEAA